MKDFPYDQYLVMIWTRVSGFVFFMTDDVEYML